MYQMYGTGIEEKTVFDDPLFLFNIFWVQGYTMHAHWHKHLEFIYARKGPSTIRLNDLDVRLEEGGLMVIFSGVVHSIENHGGIYEAFLIGDGLLKDLMYDKDYQGVIRRLYEVEDPTHIIFESGAEGDEVIHAQLKLVKEEFQSKSAGYRMMIKSGLSHLLVAIERRLPVVDQEAIKVNTTLAYIKKALDYVEENYMHKITLSDLSHHLHLSEQYFGKIFKSYTNKTFIEYLTIYRLEKSEWYLKYSDKPITSIPGYIGFCNANYYARTYKEYFHQSPRDTRREHLRNLKNLE